jgi:hypothetical protein
MDIHVQILNTPFLDECRDENSPSYNFSWCIIFVGNAIEVECDVANSVNILHTLHHSIP